MYGSNASQELETMQRQQKALTLRLDGWSFDDIAAEVGYSDRSAARKAYRAALKRNVSKADADELREQHRLRVAGYRKALAPYKAEPRAVEVMLKADEHEARLFGLYQEPKAAVLAPIVIYEYPYQFGAAVRGELDRRTNVLDEGVTQDGE